MILLPMKTFAACVALAAAALANDARAAGPAVAATDLHYARFEAMQIATAPLSRTLALSDR